MSLQILDPTQYPGWDEILLSTPHYSFFHSSEWARVLSESYGFKPKYFADIHGGKFSILIPFMEVNSYITGKRGVSLPFSDYCEPIIDKEILFFDIFLEIVKFARKKGWKYIEFRGGRHLFNHLNLSEKVSSNYLTHEIDLKKDINILYESLRDSNRRNIKRANGFGLKVEFSNKWDSMESFYFLNKLTRKRHGLPPQPKNFFKNFYEKIIRSSRAIIALASYNGYPVSAYIFCLFGKKAIYKYGASDLTFKDLRTNNLLMWESIKWLYEHGYEELSLGRTEQNNQGLRQFKNGWGGKEGYIYYYSYDLKKNDFVLKENRVSNWQKWILKRIPISVLNLLGSIFYRHAA